MGQFLGFEIFDMFRGSGYDYVDAHYWSVQQIMLKHYAFGKPLKVMDLDKGKVTLFVNMTLENSNKEETDQQMRDL